VRAVVLVLLASPDFAQEHQRAATALRFLLQVPGCQGEKSAARFLSAAHRAALVASVTAEMANLPCALTPEASGAGSLVSLAQVLCSASSTSAFKDKA